MAAPETTDALPPVTVPVNTPFTPFSPWDIERIIAIPQENYREDTATILFTRQLLVNGRHLEMRLVHHNVREELRRDRKAPTNRKVFPNNGIVWNTIEMMQIAPYEIQIVDLEAAEGNPFAIEYSVSLDTPQRIPEEQYRAVVQKMEDGTTKAGFYDFQGEQTQPLLRRGNLLPHEEALKQEEDKIKDLDTLLRNIQIVFHDPSEIPAGTVRPWREDKRTLAPIEDRGQDALTPEDLILPAEDNAETA